MILQELYKLYGRLDERGADVPRKGQSMQKISFRVVIRLDGSLAGIRDAREVETEVKKGKQKPIAKDLLVLGHSKSHGPGVDPCFLWDNPAYLLGYAEGKDRALEYFEALKSKHCAVECAVGSARFSAVCRFLESWDPARCAEEFPDKECLKGNGVFRIQGDEIDVHEDPDVVRWWNAQGCGMWRGGESQEGMCLVTGQVGPIARLHEPAIRGVYGAGTDPRIVSFNQNAFESYGKEQSLNASVSEKAAFAYCNALNYLLRNERTRVQMPGTTIVFWTDSPTENEEEDESLAGYALDSSRAPAMDEALAKRVHARLEEIASGRELGDTLQREDATRFFILGLSPNVSRLSVRFFHESTLGDFIRNLAAHYDALRIQKRGEKFQDSDIISPYMILRETAREKEDISPLFGGALMRSILLGLPYPDAIAMAILRRFRADPNISRTRCAFLKAWLIRKNPSLNPLIMLDTKNTQPGYVMGRLFAILQKAQKDAFKGDIARTIQDAYYGSASVTPQSVFPRILRMYRHHLSMLPKGHQVFYEKLLQEVMDLLPIFPKHLNPEQQGLFALGFYHQTQALYLSKATQD